MNKDAPECEPFATVREVGSYLHGLCRAGYCAKDKNFKETHHYIGRQLHLMMTPKANPADQQNLGQRDEIDFCNLCDKIRCTTTFKVDIFLV